jgi:ferrochelatase
MTTRHVVLLTYGEPPTPEFFSQLKYSWRILLGLTRSVASIPAPVLPLIAVSRGRKRNQMWTEEKYGSPLEAITRAQAQGLSAALDTVAHDESWRLHVAYEFRDPLLTTMLGRLPEGKPVYIVPMYVADSAFTHEISRRTIEAWTRGRAPRSAPVQVLPALDEEQLAKLMAAHVREKLTDRGIATGKDWALVLAAHGTLLEPQRPIETGREATERICAAIARRLKPDYGLIVNGWLNHTMGGRWTEPPADVALKQVAEAGYRRVVYFPYGFLADNAESELEGRQVLRTQGWAEVVHLPCVNAAPAFLTELARYVVKHAIPESNLRVSDLQTPELISAPSGSLP